ncbi:MAG: hypothetical protein PHI66_00050 [Candidatus Pacebacteria bacterium]|nr:hypothetical protein [Candidatus Paceibacterota bacterium]
MPIGMLTALMILSMIVQILPLRHYRPEDGKKLVSICGIVRTLGIMIGNLDQATVKPGQ